MSINKDNLIVGLLVLAVVVAVAGTWVNLNKVSGITGLGVAGAEHQGEASVVFVEGGTFKFELNDLVLVEDGENTVIDEDCYEATNGTGSPWVAVHPSQCGGNLSIQVYNATIVSNAKHNWSIRFDNATGTTGWLTGATSAQFMGDTTIESGSIGAGVLLLNNQWTNNSNAVYITKIRDVSAGSTYTVLQDWAITIDPLETTGSKNAQMSSAITFTS